MASSGTASFTVTRNDMIESAYRKLRTLKEGDVPNAKQIRYANMALNMLLKNMQSNGLQLWTYQLIAIPMVAGQMVYTIGPVGTDVVTTRPLRLFDGSYIRNTQNGVNYDQPLRIISRQEYLQYGDKGSQSIPNSIYYDSKIDSGAVTSPSTGYGNLYVYATLASGSSYTVYGNFQRPIYDITSADQEFDLPQEWFRPLSFMLAADLSYEVPDVNPQVATNLHQMAKMLHDEVQDWSVETASMYLTPDSQMYYR